MEASLGPIESTPVNWRGLSAAEPEALAAASSEVETFVRALAAYGVIVDRDAVPSELEDRQNTLRSKLWSSQPLEGYELHSSLGAYLVTKVAVDLVPTGHLGLRPQHLSPEGLRNALADLGVSTLAALSVIGDWPGEPEGFRGDASGLPLSVLAGLAERTLTRQERIAALAQVAASPRDLARLAATTNLLNAVRTVLPLLPIPSMGPGYDLAIVGLSIGRGDRIAALLQPPRDVLMAALSELAAAHAALAAGESVTFELDSQVAAPGPLSGDLLPDNDGGGDAAAALASVCRWRGGPLDEGDIDNWYAGMRRWTRTSGTLGLRLSAPAPTVVDAAIPPEAGLVRRAIFPHGDATDRIDLEAPPFHWRGDPLDAVAPVIRGAVRVVASAAEGQAPPEGATERAGDLAWLVRRAAALAAVVQGDLHRAIAVTEALPPGAAPERRWAQDRLRRFGERAAEPAEPDEARPMGSALIGDLAHQLARTITSTVPPTRR